MRKYNLLGLGIVVVGLAVVIAASCSVTPAGAVTCEYPLFIQQGSVDANVMFLFDSSGSMNEIICHDSYNPKTNYSGGLSGTTTYTVADDGTYSARSFKSGLPRNPTAKLVDSDGGYDGEYSGNYLNWIFYHATATERAAIPQYTRIQMAKTAVNAIISGAAANIRFGMYKFNGDNGGTKVADMGTARAAITTALSGISGDSWTPLAETLVSIMYYLDNTGVNAPIQYECQKTFVVIVTDGYPTKDLNIPDAIKNGEPAGTCADLGAVGYPASNDCSGYLDNVAGWLRNHDLRTDLEGEQYACTYTVGMNIDAPILAATADAGDGEYFSANNAAELSASLDKVLRDIVNRISAGSAVAVVSTEGETDDLLYRGKFQPSDWAGFLEAFELPYEAGEAPVWEAGELLSNRTPSSRTIFTSKNGAKVDFVAGQASNLRTLMGAASDAVATNIINWTRGTAVTGYRDRGGWLLGDIVDSSPVPVGPPTSYYTNNNYISFRDANENRERVIYVGSNDAMVHCFAADTGEERWAYIPNDQLDHLAAIANTGYCHEYSVNLSPRAVDVYIGSAWKTVLIGGEKQGGAAYYALDVTDPNSPAFLWENNLAGVTASWALPEVTRIKSNDKYVAFVGSGYDASGKANLVGMDMSNGTAVWTISLGTKTGVNMATTCTAVDLQFDGYDDVLYLGDMAGKLWRVDLTTNTPTASVLFTAPSGQTIQAPPTVTVDYDNTVFIYFGTGKYVDPADMTTTTAQTFYCIKDNHSGSSLTLGNLVNQTTAVNNVAAARGWYISLPASGERVTEPAALVAGVVYFTSFAPSDVKCGSGGESWLYSVKWRNGAAHDDDDNDANDTASGRSTTMGDGITARPVIDIINEKVLVQGSDTRIHISDTLGQIRQLIVRSYRQQY